MSHARRGAWAAWAIVAGSMLWAPHAGATVMVEVPLDDMVRDADAVVLGTVVSTGVQLVMEDGGLIPNTLTRVRVREWLRGDGPRIITIRELGGEWQGRGMRIEGTPRYAPGEQVVVFLAVHPAHPSDYRTYGMVQGRFVVIPGVPGVPTTVRRDLSAITFAHWVDGQMTLAPAQDGPVMQLDGFLDLIRRAP